MITALHVARRAAIAAILLLSALPTWCAIDWYGPPAPGTVVPGKILYYFRTADSVLCRELEQGVFTDAAVAAAAKEYACVQVDASVPAHRELLGKMQVLRVPVIVLTEDGRELRRLSHVAARDQVLAFLTDPSTGDGKTPARARVATMTPPPAPVFASSPSLGGGAQATKDDKRGDSPQPALDLVRVSAVASPTALTVKLYTAAAPNDLSRYMVFVDNDSNPSTGFSVDGHRGGDYMVQGTGLFAYSGKTGTDWSWNPVNQVSATLLPDAVSIEIPVAMIGGKFAPEVLVWAGTQDTSWKTLDWAPDEASVSLRQGGGAAASSGASAASVATDRKGDSPDPTLDLVSLSARRDGQNVVFTVEMASAPNSSRAIHVMIDSDMSPATGCLANGRGGADFMIEGAMLHKHKGKPGSAEWAWDNIGGVESSILGQSVEYTVPAASVGVEPGKPFRAWCSTTDANWHPVDWLPEVDSLVVKP